MIINILKIKNNYFLKKTIKFSLFIIVCFMLLNVCKVIAKEYTNSFKIYKVHNEYNKKNDNITHNDFLKQVDNDVSFYYSKEGGNYYDNGVYNSKIEILKLAKELNLNNLLTKMKDFCYHPYAVCEYQKFTKEELVVLKKELEKIFEEYKEIDKGGPTGFASNSVIANIKSINVAIENYSDEKHKKYNSLKPYMYKDGLYDKYFTLSQNLVNTYVSPYERSYKRTPGNRTEIRNIKDKGEYYEADLIIREYLYIDSEIADNINVNDEIHIWTTEEDETDNNSIILKCIKTSNYEGDGYDGRKWAYFKLLRGNDEYNNYILDYEMTYLLEDDKYIISDCVDEASKDILQNIKMPIRILKNARVLGSYFLDSIDKPLSNNHDYEFKEDFKDVLLKDIYNKEINFQYPNCREYYYPIIKNDKNDDEFLDEYAETYLCDNFQYITMLTYDDKGYITGIYKGEN